MEKQVRYRVREVFAESDPREREMTLKKLMEEYRELIKKEVLEGQAPGGNGEA